MQLRAQRECQAVGRLAAMRFQKTSGTKQRDQSQLERKRGPQYSPDPIFRCFRVILWIPRIISTSPLSFIRQQFIVPSPLAALTRIFLTFTVKTRQLITP